MLTGHNICILKKEVNVMPTKKQVANAARTLAKDGASKRAKSQASGVLADHRQEQ
jgi:hypothetical protein